MNINGIIKILNEICDNENEFCDNELAKKFDEVYKLCFGGTTGKDFIFITHIRSTNLLKKRAKRYCKKHHIKLENYNGVLPYRKYFIETL